MTKKLDDMLLQIKDLSGKIKNTLQLGDIEKYDKYIIFFEGIKNRINKDNYESLVQEIINLYGGMGSFNDLILYKNGNILKKDNKILDELRSNMYQLCIDTAEFRNSDSIDKRNEDIIERRKEKQE